jgi:hypothetical protein
MTIHRCRRIRGHPFAIIVAILAPSVTAVGQSVPWLGWSSFSGGGGKSSGGGIALTGMAGQCAAEDSSSGGLWLCTGFWCVPGSLCYANCDSSTAPPILNVNDFQCFLNKFAAGDSYANCDHSTVPPILNVNDFQCFLNQFAAGCG